MKRSWCSHFYKKNHYNLFVKFSNQISRYLTTVETQIKARLVINNIDITTFNDNKQW